MGLSSLTPPIRKCHFNFENIEFHILAWLNEISKTTVCTLTLVSHKSYFYRIYSNTFHILAFNTNFDSLTIIEVMKVLVRSFFVQSDVYIWSPPDILTGRGCRIKLILSHVWIKFIYHKIFVKKHCLFKVTLGKTSFQ